MHARVSFILARLNADFRLAGLGEITYVSDPEPGWAGPVWAFGGHRTASGYDDVESATASLASAFQDGVIDDRHGAWPTVDGRALFASAESGVACWCLDGKPWCAIGQLSGALEAASSTLSE
jgi:hypothetical protein